MNWIGFWTYLVLLVMQNSTKLDVFLGVCNFSEQLLPAHLGFMQGFMTRKPMNLLFPVSVTVSTVALVLIVEHALAEGLGPAQMAGATLLASLLALAILEHWLLMLPIPAERLWQWGHSVRGKTALTDAGHDGSYQQARPKFSHQVIHNHDGDGGHDEGDPRTLSVITSIDQLFDSEEIGRFVSRAADGGIGEIERMKVS